MAHEHKYSTGKVRYDFVDAEAVHGVALAFTHGQEKGYEPYSWRLVPKEEYIAAYQRHMREHLRGHLFDEESGLLHIDHATACLNILRWFTVQDDKTKKQMEKGKYK